MTAGNILNSSKYFWWSAPFVFFFRHFWWLSILFFPFLPILRELWWFFFPIFLYFPLKKIYYHWLNWDVWYSLEGNWILLEIVPPEENIKPFKAMQDILSVLWSTIDSPNWRERNCEGMLPLGGGLWLSLEIASFGGEIHFFLRCKKEFKERVEGVFYSQYPEIEIKETDDYTQKVPQNIPNEKYVVLGEDFAFLKPHPYPLKTYTSFFEPPEGRIERKRIDPLNSLLEDLSNVGQYEQVWIQIICNPIFDVNLPWTWEGKAIARKIARRPEPKKEGVFEKEMKKVIYGSGGGGGGGKAISPARTETGELEMVITPRERKLLTQIEEKLSKKVYSTTIRTIYIARKDKVHDEGRAKIMRTYLNHFAQEDGNLFLYWGSLALASLILS